MKFVKRVIVFVLLVLILAGKPDRPVVAQTTPVIISDGTFNDLDWSIYKVKSVGGTSHTFQQSLSGDNHGAFRSMTHTLPPVLPNMQAEIEVTHLFLSGSYDPGLQGAIDHIDYAEDGIQLALP